MDQSIQDEIQRLKDAIEEKNTLLCRQKALIDRQNSALEELETVRQKVLQQKQTIDELHLANRPLLKKVIDRLSRLFRNE